MKLVGLLISFLLTCHLLFAVDAKIAHASFQQDNKAYIELYTHIQGSSLAFDVPSDSLQQASVAVTVIIRQLDQIVLADKFNLLSPVAATVPDLIDLKRYVLDNGEYDIEVQFVDNNDPESTAQRTSTFIINYDGSSVELSDLELLTSVAPIDDATHPFAKQQYQLEPLVESYYPGNTDKLLFYAELYAPEQSGILQLKYFLRKARNYTDQELKIAYQKTQSKSTTTIVTGIGNNGCAYRRL